MTCCDRDGYLATLRLAFRIVRFFRLHRAADRLQKIKINAMVLRHPFLKTHPR